MADRIYGRQATDAGVALGKAFESNPNLFDQYVRSLEAVDPNMVSDTDYRELAKHTLDRLVNEEILIYLADSIKTFMGESGIGGVYTTGSLLDDVLDRPDTAFVAKHDYGNRLPARYMVNASLHEALLHGAGMSHKSRVNPLFGKRGSELLDYLFPGKIVPTEEQARKSGQWAYKFEEADLEDAMRKDQAYLPYAELLLGGERYLEEVSPFTKKDLDIIRESLKPILESPE